MLYEVITVFQPERVQMLIERLRNVFAHVRPHFHYIPLYGSLWGMACASDRTDPAALDGDLITKRIHDYPIDKLQYYNADTHRAAFLYPNFLREFSPRAMRCWMEAPVIWAGGRLY